MLVVASRMCETCLPGGLLQRVRREVRLVIGDVWGVRVRLMTMGRMSTSVPGQCCRMALARGVYLSRVSCAVWERLSYVQYFHSPI
jgi:hypothetical protein